MNIFFTKNPNQFFFSWGGEWVDGCWGGGGGAARVSKFFYYKSKFQI